MTPLFWVMTPVVQGQKETPGSLLLASPKERRCYGSLYDHDSSWFQSPPQPHSNNSGSWQVQTGPEGWPILHDPQATTKSKTWKCVICDLKLTARCSSSCWMAKNKLENHKVMCIGRSAKFLTRLRLSFREQKVEVKHPGPRG